MGLDGAELLSFVKEQQKIEREDRDKERERLREKEREAAEKEKQRVFLQAEADGKAAEQEKERAEREQERAEKEKERAFRREEGERQERQRKHEFEKAQMAFDQELERAKFASIQHQEEERERHRSELERMEMQAQLRERGYAIPPQQVQVRVAPRETSEEAAELYRTQDETAQVADVSRMSTDDANPAAVGRSSGRAPKMPYFDEERDSMDSYLSRFERFAASQRWVRMDWALYLSALLKGRALDVYSMLPADQADDYDRLKDALLKRYQLSADGFKKRFRSAKPESGETPIQFLTRIDNYLKRWIELAKADKTYEGLKALIVQEQYLSICPTEMAMHLKEGKPNSIQELGERAENYVEAHATGIVFGIDPKPANIRSLRSETRQCHNCKEFGHLQRQCSKPPSPRRVRSMPGTSNPPSWPS